MFREKENGFVIIMIKILGMFQYTGLFGRIICEIQLLNFSKKQNTNGFLRVLWFEFPFCHTIWFLAEKEKLFTTQPNDGKSINSNIFFLNLYGHTHTPHTHTCTACLCILASKIHLLWCFLLFKHEQDTKL